MEQSTFAPKAIDASGKSAPFIDSQVKVKAIYFSAHWCPPCRGFTPKLAKFYNAVNKSEKKIEVLFISRDKDEKSFKEYYAEMPWLTIDYNDADRNELPKKYKVNGIPNLVIIDGNGNVLNDDVVGDLWEAKETDYEEVFNNWASANKELPPLNPKAIDASGKPAPFIDSQAQVKAIYFSAHWCPPCKAFTPKLAKFYNTVNKSEKKLEVLFISRDKDEQSYKDYYAEMPWLTIDYNDADRKKLPKRYKVNGIPNLVIIDNSGNVLKDDAVGELWEADEKDYEEIFSYWADPKKELPPFDPKVIDASGKPAPFLDSKAQIKAIYFSAHWCPPCRAFTPKLATFYKTINESEKKLEVLFISRDKDEQSYKDYYAEMPWLTIDFNDDDRKKLPKRYKLEGIPCLVIIDGKGNVLNNEAVGDLWEAEKEDYENIFKTWSSLIKA